MTLSARIAVVLVFLIGGLALITLFEPEQPPRPADEADAISM